MSTSALKALPGKLDIKRHSPSILYFSSKNWVLVNIAESDVLPQSAYLVLLILCLHLLQWRVWYVLFKSPLINLRLILQLEDGFLGVWFVALSPGQQLW